MSGAEKIALGAISGTSMDGIDLAVLRTDGIQVLERFGGVEHPYPEDLRADLQAFLGDDPSRAERDPLTALERRVTDAFAEAIEAFLEARSELKIDVIGLHGQTVWHRPEARITRQLGDGALLATRLGIETVGQFRLADVEAGGQGAPLAPLYHRALAGNPKVPLAILNLGGVANVTYLQGDTVLAFDTGPASAMIDDFVIRHFGRPFDQEGALAGKGKPDDVIIQAFLAHPFFRQAPPKSLDRQAFHPAMNAVEGLENRYDAVATLTQMTIEATVMALHHLPARPERWLVCGGGRHNGAILHGLRKAVGVPVEPVDSLGWDGDLVEAECFAFLAVRSITGLPLSLPTTTGVPSPMPGGVSHTPGR